MENIKILFAAKKQLDGKSFFEKLNYVTVLNKVKKSIREFKPDIVHAHYASSYGMLGALSKFHPFIISVWGADVFDFPKQSPLHKRIFKYNLKKADYIFSTSYVMKEETEKYTAKEIGVTPFGVDTEIFKPQKVRSLFADGTIVVGLVKSLETKYGIDVLIRSFALAKKLRPALPLKLLLVGKGSLETKLKYLVSELKIEKDVVFTGKIPHQDVPQYHNMIDIYVSVSVDDSESFGVSAVEACACAKAVIVSRAGGLKEVVIENETGLIVEKGNEKETADAIIKFAEDEKLRKKFGEKARERVLKHYNWKENLDMMVENYHSILSAKKD